MKILSKNIALILLITLLISCSNENLNGHYHLEWEHAEQFQTWNIKNNRMVINRSVCPDEDDNCFSSQISFVGDSMFVMPWVDINFECKYSIDKNGIVIMKYGENTAKLIPHSNCKSNTEYFSEKTKNHKESIQFIEETMTGKAVLPSEYENELIAIYKNKDEKSILLFNGKRIQNLEEIPKSQNKSIWLHLDKRIELKEILPILQNINQKGYEIYFSALSQSENNEEVQLLSRKIESINNVDKGFEVEICDFCEKYLVSQIDSILRIEVIEAEKYFIQGDTVDLFQTRKRIVRFLGKNRTARLNTQIQFVIPQHTTFEIYFRLIDEMKFVHIELSDIMTYSGENDKDMEAIRNDILDRKKEFPIRIKEIIKN